MSDLAQHAIILAVAAGLFFWLGTYFAGGRKSEPVEAAPDEKPRPAVDPEVASLRAELEAAREREAVLEADLTKARTLLEPAAEGVAAPVLGSDSDPELGPIYAIRPEMADDLTKIRGIGAALSRRLNELGVYTFSQIAAWEKSQVDAFSTRLSFKDRIVRDDWVGQAGRLCR